MYSTWSKGKKEQIQCLDKGIKTERRNTIAAT